MKTGASSFGLRYTLQPAEIDALSRPPEGFGKKKVAVFGVIWGVFSLLLLANVWLLLSGVEPRNPLSLTLRSVMISFFVLQVYAYWGWWSPVYYRSVDIEIDGSGIGGTLDGRAVRIAWPAINEARRGETAIVIVSRATPWSGGGFRLFSKMIAVPLRAIPGGSDALWALLQTNLVGERSLVKGASMASRLTNTAASARLWS